MEKFDLAVAYLWEFDQDFIHLLEKVFHENGLTTFIISEHNIDEVKNRITGKNLHFRFYLDRAWDVDDRFGELGKILAKRKTVIFNQYNKVLHAIDKATMHLEFITAGLNVPYSIIIPPQSEKEKIFISVSDLARIRRPFIIKPCNTTGGGIGVVTGAESLQEVLEERVTNSNDKYLIQEKIYPKIIDGKRAWFRAFWVFDEAIPVWWDDQTHLYKELRGYEVTQYNLKKLFSITKKIGSITQLDFFSTEIVLTENDKFIAIDYVNDQCDLRFQSGHLDGVPDVLISRIINKFKNRVKNLKRKMILK